jgi:hypothetical protein
MTRGTRAILGFIFGRERQQNGFGISVNIETNHLFLPTVDPENFRFLSSGSPFIASRLIR